MIRAALRLAARGMYVFPCGVGSKNPATPHGYKDASRDPDVIRAWWQEEPQFNVAIATGSISGVWVQDVDGLDAEAELRRLEQRHGELPASVESITPRGRHIYFRMPEVPLRCSAGKVAPGIDIRADGGFAVVPPSVHPSGARYHWSVDSAQSFAVAPDWLIAKAADAAPKRTATPAAEWRSLATNGVSEGQRDCTITRLAGHLMRRFVDPFVVLELLQAWNATRCKPPLPTADVERIANSIAAKELRRRTSG
jgi:hypothetical protein